MNRVGSTSKGRRPQGGLSEQAGFGRWEAALLAAACAVPPLTEGSQSIRKARTCGEELWVDSSWGQWPQLGWLVPKENGLEKH